MIRKSPRLNNKAGKSNYGVCDICGRVVYADELKRTYGTRGKLLVCAEDYENPHPQDHLKAVKELPPRISNPLQADTTKSITSSNIVSGTSSYASGNAPNPPTNVKVTSVSTTSLELQWIPGAPGSSSVVGYKIERETGIGGGFSTIKTLTDTAASYYLDTGLTASTLYNYRISATNHHGTGNTSDEANGTTRT